ncbi:hypothetical protein BD311DRAFT_753364 [Dichomitus squalens]|uniref:C3H1-type domain-containing protein n=1 Tax=Dichomitus squalens TaxID=114155 RepID=A0A4V2K129_9APHY|nr:hypothetical protein BD311DRAFT_753364 [Dichomitus squalens]
MFLEFCNINCRGRTVPAYDGQVCPYGPPCMFTHPHPVSRASGSARQTSSPMQDFQ